MKAYHVINPNSLDTILRDGLVRTSRGDKGDDHMIIKTDRFLDDRCPQQLRMQGVSRDNNLYAYVRASNAIIDITDGEHVPIGVFTAKNNLTLEIDIDPTKCFVSDLDAFDALKSGIESKENMDNLEKLAERYWQAVYQLSDTDTNDIRRPEIMITYDLAPKHITPLR